MPISRSITLGDNAGGSDTVEPVAIETSIAVDPGHFTFTDDDTFTDAMSETGR